MKKFILAIYDDYDTYELEFSNEKELVESIVNRKLAPNDFRISEIIDPKTLNLLIINKFLRKTNQLLIGGRQRVLQYY